MGAKKEDAQGKPLTPVMEDYLEAIFGLDSDEDIKAIRVRDIARKLNVKMPSVTSMLKVLNDRGLVKYEKYEYLELTEQGKAVGREIKKRHHILKRFLTRVLNIDGVTADEEACKMEHALSSSTMDTLTAFMDFIQICPRAGDDWVERFQAYQRQGQNPGACGENFENFMCESAGARDVSGRCCMEGKMNLSQMKEGQKGRILRVGGEVRLRRRLIEMGLTRGVYFSIEKYAPLKDPLELIINGSHVSLRVKEAAEITVVPEDAKGVVNE